MGTVLGRDILWRKFVEGVDRPLAAEIEGPRVWPGGFRPYVDGLGVVLFELIEILVFGMPGVFGGIAAWVDLSDIGGEGGVCVSDRPDDDTVFPGGVSNEGDESVVVGESSERGEVESGIDSSGGNLLPSSIFPFTFLNFPWMISASIFRSDSSSRSR